MAEDQDKQKPKTTLIKKKAESGDSGEKKKVRVVVKRKAKAKPAAEETSGDCGPPARRIDGGGLEGQGTPSYVSGV